MLWFKKTLRRNSSTIIKSALASSQNGRDTNYKVEDNMQVEIDEFYRKVMNKCEENFMDGNRFLSGQQMSIVDVIVYCEIITITKLLAQPIPTAILPLTA